MALPTVERGTFLVIRTDGTEETVRETPTSARVCKAIGAETLDYVPLSFDGQGRADLVMGLDDAGWEYDVVRVAENHIRHVPTKALKPVNPKATAFYHSTNPAYPDHQIVGDVVVCRDRDFA